MQVDKVVIYDDEVSFVEVDGQEFHGDDYTSTREALQAIINYVEHQALRGIQ